MGGIRRLNADQLKALRPLGLGLLVGLVVFLLAEVLIQLEQLREFEAMRNRLQSEASAVRARLESEWNSTFSIGLSAASLVSAKPDFSARNYERLAQSLAAWHPGLRNLAIAPDNVIRYVYPLAGNEAVLGLNLETIPGQAEPVKRMRKSWMPIIAGPLRLMQGGMGFAHQVPVIVVDDNNVAHYWGLVSVTLDTAHVFEKMSLTTRDDAIVYALRGRDGKGAIGDVFFGPGRLFTSKTAIKMNMAVPGGDWQLAADWREAGTAFSWRIVFWHALAIFLGVSAGGLVAFAVRSQGRLQVLASHDSLTRLANRHQFLVQAESFLALAARQKYSVTLLNLDLEGFKGINDDYGHEVGDAMLVHVAARVKECLRASDIVARFGGDEFLVLLPETQPGPELDILITRLRESVSQTLTVKGHMLSVGMSVGVATYPDDGFSLTDLVRISDFNMYADKRLRKWGGVQGSLVP